MNKVAEIIIDKLDKERKLQKEETAYHKTEKLLTYYTVFKKKLKERDEALKDTVIKKTSVMGNLGNESHCQTYEIKSDYEKLEDKKEDLMKLYEKYQIIVTMVDLALKEIKDDKYYEVIDLYYFKKYRWEDIEEELDLDNSVIYRNKKRLITELSTILFPEDLI